MDLRRFEIGWRLKSNAGIVVYPKGYDLSIQSNTDKALKLTEFGF